MSNHYLISGSKHRYLEFQNIPQDAVVLGSFMPQMPGESSEVYYCLPDEYESANAHWLTMRDKRKIIRDSYFSQPWV